MYVLPELLIDALRREHTLSLERDLERRRLARLAGLARAVADCCRPSTLARTLGVLRHPLGALRMTG